MRTKVLLGAAILAAGLAASSAQVYSLNVVGYVNVVFPTGYSLVANPLDAGDNTINALWPAPGSTMDGNTVYTWNGTFFVGNDCDMFTGWGDPSLNLPPGKGFFVKNTTGAPITNTFVGTVLQGNLTNSPTASPLYSLLGNKVPKAGYLADPAGLAMTDAQFGGAAAGDTVYLWNGSFFVGIDNDMFTGWPTSVPPFTMDPTGNYGPQINLGGAFFYRNNSAVCTWVQNFTVQ